MKQLKTNFGEYLRTPFPYLFLFLCLFLGSNMVRNESFNHALNLNSVRKVTPYELCLVCSDPNSKDALSDIGFTVSNFILFPVNAASLGISQASNGALPNTVANGLYIAFSGAFGLLLPFAFFSIFGLYKAHAQTDQVSIHVRSSAR